MRTRSWLGAIAVCLTAAGAGWTAADTPRFRAGMAAGTRPASVRAARASVTAVVAVVNYRFEADGNPGTQIDIVTIAPGDAVRWEWGQGVHTATSGVPDDPDAGLDFDAPLDQGHPEFTYQFFALGDYPYFCRNHYLSPTNMLGLVRVQEPLDVPRGSSAQGVRFLGAPWPNPSRGRIETRIEVGSPGVIDLTVFDPRGRRVATLFHGERSAGQWAIAWDGRDQRGQAAGSGVYYLRLTAGGRSDTRRLVIGR